MAEAVRLPHEDWSFDVAVETQVFEYVRDLVFYGMLGTGVLYGALAPFLAPLQVRHPQIGDLQL